MPAHPSCTWPTKGLPPTAPTTSRKLVSAALLLPQDHAVLGSVLNLMLASRPPPPPLGWVGRQTHPCPIPNVCCCIPSFSRAAATIRCDTETAWRPLLVPQTRLRV